MDSKKSIAKVVFSIDTELAWARIHHRNLDDYTESLAEYRNAVDWLLHSFEKYEIPATWAIVGHLFLNNCTSPPHPNITKPEYDWIEGDWYKFDPCSDVKEDPFFYAPDIIEKISDSPIKHEIASHSFAHINFADPGCSYKAAFDDLNECQLIYRERNSKKMKSFVFPQDKVGNLKALRDAEFEVFRGAGVYEDLRSSSKFSKLLFTLKNIFGLANQPIEANWENGLVNLPLSNHHRLERPMNINNPYSFVPLYSKYLVLRNSIKAAIETGRIAHIGLHPIDFGLNSEKFRTHFEKILAFIQQSSKKGNIEIITMSDIVD